MLSGFHQFSPDQFVNVVKSKSKTGFEAVYTESRAKVTTASSPDSSSSINNNNSSTRNYNKINNNSNNFNYIIV